MEWGNFILQLNLSFGFFMLTVLMRFFLWLRSVMWLFGWSRKRRLYSSHLDLWKRVNIVRHLPICRRRRSRRREKGGEKSPSFPMRSVSLPRSVNEEQRSAVSYFSNGAELLRPLIMVRHHNRPVQIQEQCMFFILFYLHKHSFSLFIFIKNS